MSKKTKAKSKKASLVSVAFSLSVIMVVIVVSLLNISFFPPKIDIQEINKAKASGESWYSTEGTWNYRKKITINNNLVADVTNPSTTYNNFPILISTTGLSNVNTNGADIRFTMADGITEIPREIESYNSGNLEAWVKLTLTKDAGDFTNDEIYMYYGNSSATEPSASSEFGSENVWNSNFVMVQHMEETDIDGGVGDIKDSTSYGNNGTTSGMDGNDQVAGNIDGSFDFDATDDRINVGSSTSLDNLSPLSISVWAKANSTGQVGQGYFIQKGAWGGVNGWRFQGIATNSTVYFWVHHSTTGLKVSAVNGSLITGELAHWYVTSDGTAVNTYIYKNGIDVSGSRTNEIGSSLDDSSYNVLLGNTTSNNRTFDGILDEVRISNIARSAEWIKTEFNNQNNSTTFLTFGSLETSLACLSIGGVCRNNACSEYLDCASLSGNCDTNNCCFGSCTTDIEYPTTPTNFSATAVSTSQIDLSWTASTDNDKVEGYKIYRCLGSSCSPTIIINTLSTNSYSDTGLVQDTLYIVVLL